MRVIYRRDDARRRVELVSHGLFDADQLIDAIERLRQEGVWGYAVVSDMRRATGTPSYDELVRLRLADAELGPNGERAGPLAIIATEFNLFRRACAYAMLASTSRPINVVEDRTEAERWLREQGF